MEELLQIGLGLFGGLALFLYGMNLMSNNLQEAAGERMRAILAAVTKNPFFGVLAGALATAVLQSSSATTVMAIGFVAAGLMGLRQAIPIIMGANIGTTITAQIIAFKLSDYVLGIVLVGFLIMQLAKQGQMKYVGTAVFGFGLLFLGIDTMGAVMKPLAENPVFTDLIAQVTGVPVLGVLVGTLMTLVVQSSSATIAVLQNFASTPGADGASIIGLDGAIPILLGDNLGTTITALLAAIGQSRDAKRVALSHCIFNLSGCLLFVWLVGPFASVVAAIPPAGPEVEVIARQIANAHTLFNVTMTALWLPLVSVMVKIVMAILPEKPRRPRDPLVDTLETPLAPHAAAAKAPLATDGATPHRRTLSRWFPVARRCRWGGTGTALPVRPAPRLFDALPPISASRGCCATMTAHLFQKGFP